MNNEKQFYILLVDDDQVDRMTVRRALNKANFPVQLAEAVDGAEAIAMIKAQKNTVTNLNDLNSFPTTSSDNFDLALLDYRLPDIDGLSLITEIKALEMDFPIIVLTGQGDEEIAVEIMKAGAADYLSKSRIESDNLVKAINNAIRIYEAEKAVAWANQRLRVSNQLLIHKNQELEKQQLQIRLQNLKLQESYQLKSEFLATMSHELRTPMNAIMGFSQLLLRQYPDPLSSQQENLIQRILNNSKNLLDMINEMLDFSKIEAGKLDYHPQSCNLKSLIMLTVEELRSLALQKHLNLTYQINLTDNYITQDSKLLQRSLVNLISNAIKFTDEGEVTIKAWEINPNQIAIAVQDTGIGIASKDLDKIFQAFRQVDQSFTRQHAGTGLGLAITDSLVKMMGGKVLVESELNAGSTFTLQIPRKKDSDCSRGGL